MPSAEEFLDAAPAPSAEEFLDIPSNAETTNTQAAREQLAEYKAGKLDLDQEHVEALDQIASAGAGPWDNLWSGVKGAMSVTVGDAVDLGVKAAKTVGEAGGRLITAVASPQSQENSKFLPNVAYGLGAGTASLIPATTNVATGLMNLAEPSEEGVRSRNAMAAFVENKTSQAREDFRQTLGAETESPEGAVAEFIPQAAIPIGVTAKTSPLIAKVADTMVEKGTQVAGEAIVKGAKVGKAVAPAALAATELATGAPWWAPLATLVAGYGAEGIPMVRKLKHAIIDTGFDKIGDIGKVLANAKEGRTVIESMQDATRVEASRLRAQVDDVIESSPGKTADAYKKAPDGSPLYNEEELSGAAKKVRQAEDKITKMREREQSLGRYATLNQILSDGAKFGIRTGLNLGEAGAVGAGLVGANAGPGDVEEASKQGAAMGIGLGILGAPSAASRQKLGLVREKLLKGKTLDESHPLYEQHKANMDSMDQGTRDYVNSFSALAKAQGKKPIVVLSPEEMVGALKTEGVDVTTAPNGFVGKEVIYANRETLASGVVPHEFIHGTGLDSHPLVVEAIKEMQSNPELKAQLETGLAKYNADLQNNLPGETLSVDSQPAEIAAALGADMMKTLPPEAIYGGRSGGQIIGKWLKDTFGSKKNSTTEQYGFPVTPKMKEALENALFDVGKSAEPGMPEVKVPEAKAEPKVYPPEVDSAAAALEVLNYKKSEARVMAETAHDELAGGKIEEIVQRALKNKRPTPFMPAKNPTLPPDAKVSEGDLEQLRASNSARLDVTAEEAAKRDAAARVGGGTASAIEEIMRRNAPQFMPSKHPDAIDKPAMRRKSDGKVFIAKDAATQHWKMAMENPELSDRFTAGGVDRYVDGWVDKKGKFLDKEEGHARASKIGQIEKDFKTEYRGALSSLDLKEGGKFMPAPKNTSVNIGLNTNEGKSITPEEAMASLKKHGVEVTKFSIQQSNTEPTLVADISRTLTPEEAHAVSVDLRQDAIAQSTPEGGALHGPGKGKWGDFNGEFFLDHDGKPLTSQEVPKEVANSPFEPPEALPASPPLEVLPPPTPKEPKGTTGLEGPIIDAGLKPSEQRFQELMAKDDASLTPKELKELNGLTFQIFKDYGSIENFEKKYPAKERGPQLMPSPNKMGGENPFESIGKSMGENITREEIGWQLPVSGTVMRFVDQLPFIKKFPEGTEGLERAKINLGQAVFNKVMGKDPEPWLKKLYESTNMTSSHFDVIWDGFQGANPDLAAHVERGKAGELNPKPDQGPDIQGELMDPDEQATRKFLEDKGYQLMPSRDLWSGLDKHLTPEERASVKERFIPRIIKEYESFPEMAKMAAMAEGGAEQKKWYQRASASILDMFGPEADRFAALLASLSPQTDVATNLSNTLKVWHEWLKADRPKDQASIDALLNENITVKEDAEAMAAYRNNAFRVLSHATAHPSELNLSGPKVDSFYRNLRDNVSELTNDRHMAGAFGKPSDYFGKGRAVPDTIMEGKDRKIKGFGYLAANIYQRKLAQHLTEKTGEPWSPMEVQAAIWSYYLAKKTGADVADVPAFDKLLRDMAPKELDNLAPPTDNPF